MGHGKLRDDKTCLNCGHEVNEHYCSHCGQENTETRQPFYFLITHFIEDFVHYDSSFWQTIKTLFTKPGKLTNEYLAGKRQSQVNPVKMYIFISFITFFIIAIFPSSSKDVTKSAENNTTEQSVMTKNEQDKLIQETLDSLKVKGVLNTEQGKQIQNAISNNNLSFTNPPDIDSLTSNKKALDELTTTINKQSSYFIPFTTKFKELKEKGMSNDEIVETVLHQFLTYIPKALFIYMPFFAFILWLFYDKKKWWYFDHGIFTLRYFSMILLSVLLIFLLVSIDSFINFGLFSILVGLVTLFLSIYIFIYFYLALNNIYKQRKTKTIIKGTVILFFNFVIISLITSGLFILSFLKAH